jgi:UDP-glucose 4-epimerase
VIAIFADRISQQRPIDIFGDGMQTRDFVFVRDAIKFFLAAMTLKEGHGKSFNVCTGRETSIVSLASTLSSIYKVEPEIRFQPARAGDIRRSIGSAERATRTLQCEASTTIADGLSEMKEAKSVARSD